MFQKPKGRNGYVPADFSYDCRTYRYKDRGRTTQPRVMANVDAVAGEMRDQMERFSSHLNVYGTGRNAFGQWGSPYKVNKRFIPPLLTSAETEPIQRQPRQKTSMSVIPKASFNKQIDPQLNLNSKGALGPGPYSAPRTAKMSTPSEQMPCTVLGEGKPMGNPQTNAQANVQYTQVGALLPDLQEAQVRAAFTTLQTSHVRPQMQHDKPYTNRKVVPEPANAGLRAACLKMHDPVTNPNFNEPRITQMRPQAGEFCTSAQARQLRVLNPRDTVNVYQPQIARSVYQTRLASATSMPQGFSTVGAVPANVAARVQAAATMAIQV